MFTESVRIGCSFPACCGGSAKYQTFLMFQLPLMTLYPDCGSQSRLEAVLLRIPTAYRLHSRLVLY